MRLDSPWLRATCSESRRARLNIIGVRQSSHRIVGCDAGELFFGRSGEARNLHGLGLAMNFSGV
jgi:hypothetical protein